MYNELSNCDIFIKKEYKVQNCLRLKTLVLNVRLISCIKGFLNTISEEIL